MMKKRITAAAVSVVLLIMCIPYGAGAADNAAYAELASQEPVYIENIACDGIYGFFADAGTDEILDPEKCNYTYGEVTVNGSPVFCHVYMRTFSVTDAARFNQTDIPELTQRVLKDVRDAVGNKYLRCIAKTYYARISYTANEKTGAVSSITVKIFIACGERTEDRKELCGDYIAQIADMLSEYDTGERFLKLNELMLDGRFSYDTELKNISSVVEFVSSGVGVCEEYAGFTSLVLDALGYKNMLITGESYGVPHIWNLVEADGRVYHLDVLQNGPINDEGVHVEVRRDYLLVSEATITKTHTVNEAFKKYSEEALYDYVFDGYPKELNGATELDGVKYLPYIPSGMKAAELRGLIQAGEFLFLYKGGETLDDESLVGTDCAAVIIVNGKTLNTYTICVKGDTDGDGMITENDINETAYYLLDADKSGYSASFALAADMNADGAVSLSDIILAHDHRRGLYDDPDGEETEGPEIPEEPSDTEGAG